MKATKTYLMAIALFAAAATTASAADYKIGTGRDGGGYDKRTDLFVQQVSDFESANFAGSEDIARAVCTDNEIVLGIAQIDAIKQMEDEGCSLETVGIYPAQEYAIYMYPDGGPSSLDKLDASNKVLVGEAGSGTALFWRTIVGIENGPDGNKSAWSTAGTEFAPYALANTRAVEGRLDAAILVTSEDSKDIQMLLSQGWNVGELDDKDINDFQFRRSNLYERSSIVIDHPSKWSDIKEDAIEVRSFWIANPDFIAENPSVLARVASIVNGIQ